MFICSPVAEPQLRQRRGGRAAPNPGPGELHPEEAVRRRGRVQPVEGRRVAQVLPEKEDGRRCQAAAAGPVV
jgi:hypothetical protein